jgi:hypothetical protein
MSQLITSPSLELLLIAGRAVALVLGLLTFAWAFRHWRRAAMRDTQRVFEQLDLVRSELLIMKEVMHHTTRKESQLHVGRDNAHGNSHANSSVNSHANSHVNSLSYRNSAPLAPAASERATTFDARLPVAPMNNTARGYEIAARMARNGAGKDELIRNCGITSHEAELLVKLHGHKQRDQQTMNSMDLIGRQPRTVEAPASSDAVARQQTSAQVLQTQSRQAAASPRQTSAAATTQRTPSAPSKSQGVVPRSRLVAVG